MATLKLSILKYKVLKNGKHKIRVAVCHHQDTCYIPTKIELDSTSQFKNGQVVKRPDAAVLNTKLRNLLNSYQEKLDKIENISIYDCKQLRQLKRKLPFKLCAENIYLNWKRRAGIVTPLY